MKLVKYGTPVNMVRNFLPSVRELLEICGSFEHCTFGKALQFTEDLSD